MAKKLITHMVGSIGIILGLVAGYTIIQAELDLNPMSYAESYEGLIFYSYSACAIVSSPFLLMQHIIEHRKNSLLIFTVLGLFLLLGALLFYDKNLGGGVLLFLSWALCPFLAGNFLCKVSSLLLGLFQK